jgi:hypothetical protein
LEEPVLAKHQRTTNQRIYYLPIGVRTFEIPEAERTAKQCSSPGTFIPRLNAAKAEKIVERVIRNAERVNAEHRDFYYD